ncbi:lauroyl-Kdo(2)-lipid IV(A) myristoyltransferase, partial [Edwardsiella tarda]
AGRLASGARRRARINLMLCFPLWSERQREETIDTMFARAGQSMLLMAELTLRGPRRLLRHTHWHGAEIIERAREQGENVIFLVPHGWAVDLPAMLLAAGGQPMAAMFHNQKNPLVDYLWNWARRRFGGRLHARNDGIKPFISSVRKGYWGYYLPDQDHGAEHSEFVDFFATYKATLPAIGRLMKLCRARVIPLFPVYDGDRSRLDIYLRPPMDDIAGQDDAYIARRMNQEVELLMESHPEQYTWILKLLKTRRPGEIEPYCRQDL